MKLTQSRIRHTMLLFKGMSPSSLTKQTPMSRSPRFPTLTDLSMKVQIFFERILDQTSIHLYIVINSSNMIHPILPSK